MREASMRTGAAFVLVGLLLAVAGAVHAEGGGDEISFKKRGSREKEFVRAVGTAIIKAAHPTAKKIDLIKYDYSSPKKDRTDLAIKMEYYGIVRGKRYLADILVKIDSANQDAWEVLNIEYTDTNASIKHNEAKVQALIKDMNR